MTLSSVSWQQRFMRLALLDGEEKVATINSDMQDIIRPENLVAMLDEFIEETHRSVHEHTDSYRHDNGYDKIVLFQDKETFMKMRLHIWYPSLIPNVSRPRQNVHNHRWDFSSVVLLGYVDHITYRFAEPTEEGEEFFHYRYYARGSKEHYDLEERAKSKLVCIGTERFEKSMLYSVTNSTLHRVDVPDDRDVATLIITHENVGWVTNDLLSEKSMGFDQVRLPSPAMTKHEIVEKVTQLRERLTAIQ